MKEELYSHTPTYCYSPYIEIKIRLRLSYRDQLVVLGDFNIPCPMGSRRKLIISETLLVVYCIDALYKVLKLCFCPE